MLRTLLISAVLMLAAPSLAEDSHPAPEQRAPDSLLRFDFAPPPAPQCCKVCRKGKACGDTCIARSKTCRVGPGCACDA